jgi:all-trans-retinol 13,14-reductase
MKSASPYKHTELPDSWDAIVIGSGIGGLGTAAMLARAGKRVLVLERHYAAGGFTHCFKRKGFEWDVGLHYVGEVHRPHTMLAKMFAHIASDRLQWEDMGEVYDIVRIGYPATGGAVYPFRKGRTNLQEDLIYWFPRDREAIHRYFALVREVAGAARGYFAEKALPAMVGMVAGGFMRRDFLRHAKRTTLDVLQELTDNPRLIAVLTGQWGDHGLPPAQSSFGMHAILVRHYLGGGAYPVGGSGQILHAIAPTIQAEGGQIVTRAGVERVLLERGRAVGVRLDNGRELSAPIVVSGIGAPNSLKLFEDAQADKLGFGPLVEGIGPSSAHICAYLGFNGTAQDLDLPRANQWIYPAGDDHDAAVAAFLADPDGAELPVVYISFPSAKDPTWSERYPGTSTVELISLCPSDRYAAWQGTPWKKRGQDYERLKAHDLARMMVHLHRLFPQLEGKLVHSELSTSLSTAHFCSYENGEVYGMDHSPARFLQRKIRASTPFKGFYMTGQDVATAGIGGALAAAMMTSSAILGRNLAKEILAS